MCYSPCQRNSQKAIYNFPASSYYAVYRLTVIKSSLLLTTTNHFLISVIKRNAPHCWRGSTSSSILLCVLCEYVEIYGMCSVRQSRHIHIIIDVAIVITKIPTLKRLGKLTSLANHVKRDHS